MLFFLSFIIFQIIWKIVFAQIHIWNRIYLLEKVCFCLSDSNMNTSWASTQQFRLTGQIIELCCEYLSVQSIWLYVIMSCMSVSVNPHSIVCLNVKELLAWSICRIWSLSDSNVIQTHNHLVCKRTLNHLTKLAKWFSCVVSI